MKKTAWPYTGSTELEMGSMGPTGDPDRDMQTDPQARYDSLTPEKSVIPDQQEPSSVIEEGMMSHMDIADTPSYNLADDKKPKEDECLVLVMSDDEEPVAEFVCDVADDISDKIAGLEPYRGLSDTAGLLFPYNRPSNVLYHMGSVSFPIDIVFIDKNSEIKKIYKNIQPGSLATFGCAGVTKVLEIVGGLSDRLGISVGNKIQITKPDKDDFINKFCSDHGGSGKVIVKYSNIAQTGFSNWKGLPLLTLNGNGITKTAKLSSSLIRNLKVKRPRFIGVYLDGFISKGGQVSVFKGAAYDDNKPCYAELGGTATCISGERTVPYYKLTVAKDEALLAGFKSLGSFIQPTNESHHIFTELNKFANDDEFDNKFFIVSKLNPSNLKELVAARIAAELGPNKIRFHEVVTFGKGDDYVKMADSLFGTFGPNTILVGDDSLKAEAGSPVPQDVKDQAKRIYKFLNDAEQIIEKSKENILHNKTTYEKIANEPEKIEKTKGQYSQSIKRQTKIVSRYLIKIRDVVRGLNKIKDISTTMEIIDSLADSSKQAADIVEEIFSLIEYLDDPGFYDMLTEKSEHYAAACDDLLSTVDRAKEYINQHVLGLTVLSK